MTGFYLNPINATNQTFGCKGLAFIDFVIVYWVAPLLATALAFKAQNELKIGIKSGKLRLPFVKAFNSDELNNNNNVLKNSSSQTNAFKKKKQTYFSVKKRGLLKQRA